MSATFEFDSFTTAPSGHRGSIIIDRNAWGLTLKTAEIPFGLMARQWTARLAGVALAGCSILHWLVTDIALNAEMLLLKLAVTAVFLTCSLLAFHFAHRSNPIAFEVDHVNRQIRTILEDGRRSVLATTQFDDIEDLFIASVDQHYALVYVLQGATSAEILVEGPYGEMEFLEWEIRRCITV
ncbi:hypothetical protein [Algirhabdus cladophorae]|uniref:hypothetical protein n=1 Tax=Algirhabdus cladophorae TaxID=3377108 RepID=UPI003B84AB06